MPVGGARWKVVRRSEPSAGATVAVDTDTLGAIWILVTHDLAERGTTTLVVVGEFVIVLGMKPDVVAKRITVIVRCTRVTEQRGRMAERPIRAESAMELSVGERARTLGRENARGDLDTAVTLERAVRMQQVTI